MEAHLVDGGCPSEDQLERLAEGEGDEALLRHLSGCAACEEAVREIRNNNRFMAGVAPIVRENDAADRMTPGELEALGFTDLQEIHRGGQGVVYRAYHTRTRRLVAIKMLLRGAMATARQRARFEREVEIAASLDHPGIVTLHESHILRSGVACFVMQFVRGESLDNWLQRNPVISAPEGAPSALRHRLEMFTLICEAISYAHERGVLHRDLKPHNILVDQEGQPKVLDFGLARTTGDQAGRTITVTGEVLGTFAYAAPEQFTGDSDLLDTRTDVYALGMILFELITGTLPYPVHGAMAELLRNVESTPPDRASLHNPFVDGDLDRIVSKALSKEPERRYAYAGALLKDLRAYLAGEAIEARQDSRLYVLRKAVRRHRSLVIFASTVMLLLLVFAIAMTVTVSELRHELAANAIEQGRNGGTSGNVALAEDVLWSQLGQRLGPFSSVEQALEQDELARSAWWALWETYSRNPCLWSATSAHGQVMNTAAAAEAPSIALGFPDGWVEVRHGRNGNVMSEWPAAPSFDDSLSLSLDRRGERLAIGLPDGSISLRSAIDGQLLGTLEGHADSILSLSFCSLDDNTLLSAAADGSCSRWDLTTGEQTADISRTVDKQYVQLDRRGEFIAATEGSELVISRWQDDAPALAFDRLKGNNDLRISFAPRGEAMALTSGGLPLPELRSLPDGELLSTIPDSLARNVVFDERGEWLATSRGTDTRLRLWRLVDGEAVRGGRVLAGLRGKVKRVGFVGGPEPTLFSVDYTQTLKAWLGDGTPLQRIPAGFEASHCLTYSADGKHIAIAGREGDKARVEIRDAETLGLLAYRTSDEDLPRPTASAVVFHPQLDRVVYCDYSGGLHVWDWKTDDHAMMTIRDEQTGVGQHLSSVSLDGERGVAVVSSSGDFSLRVVDISDPQAMVVLHTLEGHRDRVPTIVTEPRSRLLISPSIDGSIRLWDYVEGRSLGALRTSGPPTRVVAISPDGRLLASGDDSWTVTLWDLETRRVVKTLEDHPCDVFSLAFSPDGRLLASGGRDNQVRLWDVASPGRCLATIDTDLKDVYSLSFSETGSRLAIGGDGNPNLILDLDEVTSCMKGNLELQLERMEARGEPVEQAGLLRDWAGAP